MLGVLCSIVRLQQASLRRPLGRWGRLMPFEA